MVGNLPGLEKMGLFKKASVRGQRALNNYRTNFLPWLYTQKFIIYISFICKFYIQDSSQFAKMLLSNLIRLQI